MFYEMTIEHDLEDKRVKDTFLTDCNLFAEAEYTGMNEFKNSNPDVTKIKRSSIREFVNQSEGESTIYDAVIADVFINEKTGKEKLLKYHVGVYAESVEDATTKVNEYMRQGLQDMRFISVKETSIIDIL